MSVANFPPDLRKAFCFSMIMIKILIFHVGLVLSEYYQIVYEDCDPVVGYWSEWEDWGGCYCKTNYEVTRYGDRYVRQGLITSVFV